MGRLTDTERARRQAEIDDALAGDYEGEVRVVHLSPWLVAGVLLLAGAATFALGAVYGHSLTCSAMTAGAGAASGD